MSRRIGLAAAAAVLAVTLTGTAHADTDSHRGAHPFDPTCFIDGAAGYCNNTGRVFHGLVFGCQSDDQITRYVRIFDIQTGNTTFSFIAPIEAHHVVQSISGQREAHSWSNLKLEEGPTVEAYVRIYFDGAWIPYAGMECVCSCGRPDKCDLTDQPGFTSLAPL